ncbi:hypothetical protein GCM10009733_006830 [Nonomuraea maheshkhaliensis]|uniref:Uncharacterized protein n=1 Tax=Nonomuraea maheshkhaliensis TaxID=419590 RepID=A0ABP4QKP9_9ACTN
MLDQHGEGVAAWHPLLIDGAAPESQGLDIGDGIAVAEAAPQRRAITGMRDCVPLWRLSRHDGAEAPS